MHIFRFFVHSFAFLAPLLPFFGAFFFTFFFAPFDIFAHFLAVFF